MLLLWARGECIIKYDVHAGHNKDLGCLLDIFIFLMSFRHNNQVETFSQVAHWSLKLYKMLISKSQQEAYYTDPHW